MKKLFTLLGLLIIGTTLFASSVTPGKWRWRNDNGTEVATAPPGATTIQSNALHIITKAEFSTGKIFRLRQKFYTSAANTSGIALQYSSDANPSNPATTGTWTTIGGPTSGTAFVTATSSNLTNGATTTGPQLPDRAGSSGTWGGGVVSNGTNGGSSLTTQAGFQYEVEYALKAATGIRAGTVYYFRLYATASGSVIPDANYEAYSIASTTTEGAAVGGDLPTIATAPDIYASTTAPGGVTGTELRAWFKADAGVATGSSTAEGATITAWNDQSSYAYNLGTIAGTPKYYRTTASNLVNFNPVVYLDGSGDYFTNSNRLMPNNTPYTFMGASVDQNTDAAFHFLFTADNSGFNFEWGKQAVSSTNNAWELYLGLGYNNHPTGHANGFSANSTADAFWTGSSFTTNNVATKITQPQVWGFNSPNTSGTGANSTLAMNTYIDGFNNATTVNQGVGNSNFFNYFRIGGNYLGGENWNGKVPEMIAWSKQLSANESQRVNTYLAIKYGTTLGQGGQTSAQTSLYNNALGLDYLATDNTIVWDHTKQGIYKYHIAGIGRDDIEALSQRQSQSVNQNTTANPNLGQIAISLGTAAATNAANTTDFTKNISYLVWGDNTDPNPLTNANTAVSPNITYQTANDGIRMKRVWQAQPTNFSQQIQVNVPTNFFSAAPLNPANCEQYVLIGSTDPTFATVTSVAVLSTATVSYNGTNYYQTNYTFPASVSYFTFGKVSGVLPGRVVLPTAPSTVVASTTQTSCVANPWTYYYDGNGNKLFAIQFNGQPVLAANNVILTAGAGPFIAGNACGDTADVMRRVVSIASNGTAYAGLNIRLYYDSAQDYAPAVLHPGQVHWFGYPGSVTDAQNSSDLTPKGLRNASYYGLTAPSGQEDGEDYAQYSNVSLPAATTDTTTFGMESDKGYVTVGGLKVFLQGAARNAAVGMMRNDLQTYTDVGVNGLLPQGDPYYSGVSTCSAAGGHYVDINNVSGRAGAVVDWIRVDVVAASSPGTVLESQALLLKPDGSVIGVDSSRPVFRRQVVPVQLVIRHRNHLAVLSQPIVDFTGSSGALSYDFTSGLGQAFNAGGDPPQEVLQNGKWCMVMGDVTGDQFCDSNDYGPLLAGVNNGDYGIYIGTDANLDGFVDSNDVGPVLASILAGYYSSIINY